MRRDVIVMGASAGGVEALSQVIAGLPEDLDAAVFVVLHMPSTGVSVLPAILQRQTSLAVSGATSGEPILPGHVYVARPDHHLIITKGSVELSRGPKENGYRPSVDVLFRSAARSYGERVIGVVLSGALDDGALGLRLIAARGGLGFVQEPAEAAFLGMPEAALEAVPDAVVAPAREIGRMIGEFSRSEARIEGDEAMADERQFVDPGHLPDPTRTAHAGAPSVFTCPECHGTLFLVEEDQYEHFECRVGHAFSAESLLAGQSSSLEAALWAALRALEERTDLTRRMAERARRLGQPQTAARFDERVSDGDHNAELLRQVLLSGEAGLD